MTQPFDARDQTPSAFDSSPETATASQIITYAAAGVDSARERRLDQNTMLKWRGVAGQILNLGPSHGKEILKLLEPFAKGDGLSLMLVTASIEIYCAGHKLEIPEKPAEAKTEFDGAFIRSPQ